MKIGAVAAFASIMGFSVGFALTSIAISGFIAVIAVAVVSFILGFMIQGDF